MLQLYIAAAVTTFVAICMFGALIRQLTLPEHNRILLVLGCMGLFMSPLAYFLVRLPLIQVVEPVLFGVTLENPTGSANPTLLSAFRLLYAPLTEEPFKLLPWSALLTMGAIAKPSRELVVPTAMAVGVAFAIGEFWLVAYLISAKPDPALAHLPWYAFGGYMSERLMTCFSHTLFALPTIVLCRHGRLFILLGLTIGMILHYLGNAPIVMMHQEAFGLSKENWSIAVQLWLVLYVFVTLFCLVGFHFGKDVLSRIIQNKMICPECGATYRQPIVLGLNMGVWRYEPCGACQKWHWVTIKNLAPLEREEEAKSPS